jgi:hypothetical protein
MMPVAIQAAMVPAGVLAVLTVHPCHDARTFQEERLQE